jgi:hypothetical protein
MLVNKTVNVTFDRSGSKVSITVDPEPLDLSNVDDDVDIEWNLGGLATAVFDRGIKIKQPGNRFSETPKSDKTHKWKRKGPGEHRKKYSYTISIIDKTNPMDPITYELDPTIRN